MNKKAISPLIVTVLLIGFAIALAAIVMTWGTSFIRTTTEETGETASKTIACANLNLEVKGWDCDASSVTIANNNDIKIVKLTVRNYDADGNILTNGVKEVTDEFLEFDVKSVPGLISRVHKIEIIPTLEGDVTCAETPITKIVKCNVETP